MEAENRSAWYLHSGNYPFFRHAREYLAESPDNRLLDEDVKQYLAFHHTQSLCPNWLTGNRAAMREIIGDCGGIKGYRSDLPVLAGTELDSLPLGKAGYQAALSNCASCRPERWVAARPKHLPCMSDYTIGRARHSD